MTFDPSRKLTRENFKTLPALCSDGAWGTQMFKQGGKPGELLELWNVDFPERVLSVARAYVDAGAQVILSNTFSANRVTLARHNAQDRVVELNKAGAAISKQAAAGRAYVFTSIGPTGKLAMMGEITPEELEDLFAEQATAQAAGGADAICIETMSDPVEAQAALRGALKATGLPVGVSFTFDSGEGGAFTMMGVSVEQAYTMALENGASFVGANCGRGIETCVAIAQRFAQAGPELPIWIKGNAGKPEMNAAGQSVYKATPQVYADAVAPLLAAGARFIGGCCGSSPDHIRAVAETLRKLARD